MRLSRLEDDVGPDGEQGAAAPPGRRCASGEDAVRWMREALAALEHEPALV